MILKSWKSNVIKWERKREREKERQKERYADRIKRKYQVDLKLTRIAEKNTNQRRTCPAIFTEKERNVLTTLDSMSRLWSRLLLPRTGVQRNISIELPSLLKESKLRTATIAASSYNSLRAFGLVSVVNSPVDGLFVTWKCSVLAAKVQISDSAVTRRIRGLNDRLVA